MTGWKKESLLPQCNCATNDTVYMLFDQLEMRNTALYEYIVMNLRLQAVVSEQHEIILKLKI